MTMSGEVWGDLSLWLAIRESALCSLGIEGTPAESEIVPFLFGWEGQRTVRFTSGLLAMSAKSHVAETRKNSGGKA